MRKPDEHRRRIKRYHEPGDLHELTFSCYRHLPLLTNDLWRLWAEAIERALAGNDFALVAFVFMPEHVHLLTHPATPYCRMARGCCATSGAAATPMPWGVVPG